MDPPDLEPDIIADKSSSIASDVRKCIQSLEDLVSYTKSPVDDTDGELSPSEATEAAGRFKIWVGNIGAHRTDRGSLEYRLRDASHIKSRVEELLEDLDCQSQQAIQILAGERIPWDRMSDDSGSEPDGGDSFNIPPGETELRQLMASVNRIITMLLRISMAIRNPASHDQFTHAKDIKTSYFEEHDMQHVEHKFPQAPKALKERLARAITARRYYLKHRELRHDAISSGIGKIYGDDRSEQQTISVVASSMETTVREMAHLDLDDDTMSESGLTQTSYASSAPESGEAPSLKIPPFPKDARTGNPFECPLCYMIISARTRKSWKKHVHSDLRPYVCTFHDCNTPYRQFERRHEWFEHEMRHHSKWYCSEGCSKCFDTRHEIVDHLRAAHGLSSSLEKLEAALASARKAPEAQMRLDCSLCGENFRILELRKHLGRHQEQLALFAMPSHMGTDESDYEDDGSEHAYLGLHSHDGSENYRDQGTDTTYYLPEPANTSIVMEPVDIEAGNEEEEDDDDDDDDEEEVEEDEDEEVLVEVIEDDELEADHQSSSHRNEDLVALSSPSESDIDAKAPEVVESGNHIPESFPFPRRQLPPPPKGILRTPKEKFPHDTASFIREGVAPLKDAEKGRNIPPDARITKIDRRFVIPEALEEAKERFEERADCVLVLRVLSQREIQRLADRTREIREARSNTTKQEEDGEEEEGRKESAKRIEAFSLAQEGID